jgi:hypothetical protein
MVIVVAAVFFACVCEVLAGEPTTRAAPNEAFFEQGVVFQPGPHTNARAYAIPAVDRLPNGDLLCVVYGANRQQRKTSWVAGKLSHDGGKTWGKEFTIIDSDRTEYADPSIVVCGDRVTVISTGTADEVDEYKATIWSARTSTDNGRTWGPMWDLPIAHNWACGNLDHALALRNGAILRPFAYDVIVENKYQATATEGEMVCRCAVLASTDGGATWQERGTVLLGDPHTRPTREQTLDEPTAVELSDGAIFMLMRTTTGRMAVSVSHDEGRTWSKPRASPLVSYDAPAVLRRLSWNPSKTIVLWNNSPTQRQPLNVAISYDDCKSWTFSRTVADVEASAPDVTGYPRQVSYPSATVLSDGTIVAVWQANHLGQIQYARFNEAWIRAGTRRNWVQGQRE